MLVRIWRNWNPHILGQNGAATVENSLEVSQKSDTELTYYPAVFYSGKLTKRIENICFKIETCTQMLIDSLFTLVRK